MRKKIAIKYVTFFLTTCYLMIYKTLKIINLNKEKYVTVT